MIKQISSILLILDPQVISKPCGGSHDWVHQTLQSFETTVLEFIIKHIIQTKFYASLNHETKECVFAV
jgi:bifunctional DNase/RNase